MLRPQELPPEPQIKAALEKLATVGITIGPHHTHDDLKQCLMEEGYFESEDTGLTSEQRIMDWLIGVMANTTSGRPHPYITDSVRWLDAECIDDEGAYSWLLEDIADVCAPDLPVKDVESGLYWVSFVLDGRRYRWEFEDNDDWMDEKLFENIAALLEARKAPARLIGLPGGQDFGVTYGDAHRLERLRAVTGLDWKWFDKMNED